jgi:hypothetical protein
MDEIIIFKRPKKPEMIGNCYKKHMDGIIIFKRPKKPYL